MPGAVPRTSTLALTNVTLPYALDLANKGFTQALAENYTLQLGVNTYKGSITHPAVAESLGMPYTKLNDLT
ncbi:Alanine dehydrogenase [compost metagenome]